MTHHRRVLVCGGRHYTNKARVFGALDDLFCPYDKATNDPSTWLPPNGVVIIAGACPTPINPDKLAIDWAVVNWTQFEEYPIDHSVDGPWPSAGPRRNQRMLDKGKPTLLLSFPGGKGTADMIRRARRAGVEVMEIQDA